MAKTFAEEDRRRLLESSYNLASTVHIAELTEDGVYAAAIEKARASYSQAREVLIAQVRASGIESSETDEARTELKKLRQKAQRSYSYIKATCEARLAGGDPDQPLSPINQLTPEELEARLNWLNETFVLRASELSDVAPVNVATTFEHIANLMASYPPAASLGLHKRLLEHAQQLLHQVGELATEKREDRKARAGLYRAREAFDLETRSFAELIRSVLRRQGRIAQSGQFIKSDEAGYQARRRSGTTVDEEPDIGTINAELLT